MAGFRRFEEIQAWQKARGLVREVYAACQAEPLRRDYGLRDQLCRAAVSSMTNIAEGFGRKGNREFIRFLDIARGSVLEVQSLSYVALDLGYVSQSTFDCLYQQAGATAAMITSLATYLHRTVEQEI